MTKQSIPTWADHAQSDPRSVAAQLRGKGDGRGERFLQAQKWFKSHAGQNEQRSLNNVFSKSESVHSAINELKYAGLTGRIQYLLIQLALRVGLVNVYDS